MLDPNRGSIQVLAIVSLPLALASGPAARPLVESAAAPAGLAAPASPDAIVGGEPVEPGDHPAVVSVSAGPGLCTGTLLAPDLVLTAAHCVASAFLQPSQLQIGLGEHVYTPMQVLGAIDFGVHPEFCDPKQDEGCGPDDVHDYAWIRLDGPASIDAAAMPSIVADEELHHQLVRRGASLELVGFGEDDDGVLGHKRRVTTTIARFSASGHDLLAGGSGRDSCYGDSGGPALARLPDGGFALVGVLSRGSDVCGSGGIYGAPLPALCWIRDDSGADVVPAGCESCDCVDLTPREAETHGCAVASARTANAPWWSIVVIAMAWRRKRAARRAARARTEP
jgi:hypothetical protein